MRAFFLVIDKVLLVPIVIRNETTKRGQPLQRPTSGVNDMINNNASISSSSSGFRKTDEKVEKACSDFMVRNCWEKKGIQYEVVTDKSRQYLGIDLVLGGKFNIDEKVKYYNCLNKELSAPSVEILTTDRNGNDIKGWFVNPKMKTHAYAFISIFTDETDYREITSGNIKSLTYLIVPKDELTDLLGDSYSKLWAEALDLKYYGRENWKGKITKKVGDFWLSYSFQLKEKPVNLVIGRDVLKSLPHSKELKVTNSFL